MLTKHGNSPSDPDDPEGRHPQGETDGEGESMEGLLRQVLGRLQTVHDKLAQMRDEIAKLTPPAPSRDWPRRMATEGLRSLQEPSVDDTTATRAGALVQRYNELYPIHRRGAYHRGSPSLDWSHACDLVRIWDDATLEKLAVLVLTTDDEWIAGTDRSFRVFASKASWADDRLKQWEQQRQR
mgnify:CR=1 FL=1